MEPVHTIDDLKSRIKEEYERANPLDIAIATWF
jgi:hypothetical protein